MKCVYIFLDEGGNFDFSKTGTNWFSFTAIVKYRPFHAHPEFTKLKYDLIEEGKNIEYFHASEDKQVVRDRVFNIIGNYLSRFRIDTLLVEKKKVGPALRPVEKFYPRMMDLLKYVIQGLSWVGVSEVIVITDQLPVRKYREAIKKAIKITLSAMLPGGVPYRILHHDSKSNAGLQIADYCNWAIYRKWENSDDRSYVLISKAIQSEFDIFRTGEIEYY